MKTDTMQHHLVTTSEEGLRLDRWFRRHFRDVPYSHFANLCRRALVRLDGTKTQGSIRLKSGQRISMPVFSPDVSAKPRSRLSMSSGLKKQLHDAVIHQDEAIIALNKPCGLATQGGSKVTRHLDAYAWIFADGGEVPRLVHRLDQGTSGVLLLARNASVAAHLAQQLRNRNIIKTYWALCHGAFMPPQGIIDKPLDDKNKVKQATTSYVTLKVCDDVSLMALRPVSGRKHQLRRHCAVLGHPILGETRLFEGVSRSKHRRLWHTPHKHLHLHARSMTLHHPVSGDIMTLRAEPPAHMMGWCQPEAYVALDEQAEGHFANLALCSR
ncbi:MAG: RluA family pseudouridine synthase [Alphaproteobacteria bacterium GM202ARS2]|nr:RluA family pseudouridine synthase [Alphaproteobacteria bacterium GM202ARS2]